MRATRKNNNLIHHILNGPATLAELYGLLHGWEPEERFPVGFAAGA